MMSDFAELPSFFRAAEPRARKVHKCKDAADQVRDYYDEIPAFGSVGCCYAEMLNDQAEGTKYFAEKSHKI